MKKYLVSYAVVKTTGTLMGTMVMTCPPITEENFDDLEGKVKATHGQATIVLGFSKFED